MLLVMSLLVRNPTAAARAGARPTGDSQPPIITMPAPFT